jgi:hypothetical protein
METLAFYKIMLELHEGRTDIDVLCLENNYKNDDFIFIQKTYERLIFLEDNGSLPSIVPSSKLLSLSEYIKQKIWFLSGPDAYYAALKDAENLVSLNKRLDLNVKLLTLDTNNMQKQITDIQNRHIKEVTEMDKLLAENKAKFSLTFTVLVAAFAWFVGVYKK